MDDDRRRVWDVVVVGAGPAGCAAARAAAAAGASTIVLERAQPPRYKTCGGGLIGPSLAALSAQLSLPVRQHVVEAEVSFRGRLSVRARARDGGRLLPLVDRAEFDAALLEAAVAAGAVRRDRALVRDVSDPDAAGPVLVSTDRGPVRGLAVVGADGTSSRVARRVGVRTAEVDLGLEAEVPLPAAQRNRWARALVLEWGPVPASYGWVFPKGDRLTVGVIGDRDRGPALRAYLADLMRRLRLTDIPGTTSSGHLTRCRAPDSPLTRGRLLVAGDAAGLLDPWTREGISFALRSGHAAGTAAAWLAGTDTAAAADAARSGYEAEVAATLGPEMAAGRLLREVHARHPALVHGAFLLPRVRRLFADVLTGATSPAAVLRRRPVSGMLSALTRI